MLDGHLAATVDARTRLKATLMRAGENRGGHPTKDADTLLKLARNLRAHLTARRRDLYRRDIAKLKTLALVYCADVIDHRDLAGMVVGLRFPGHVGHQSGHQGNWYYLA